MLVIIFVEFQHSLLRRTACQRMKIFGSYNHSNSFRYVITFVQGGQDTYELSRGVTHVNTWNISFMRNV
jgi:hypothetical protein